MGKLISIIVPVYKIENYIEECVNSLLRQTYKNLEIILVDDGSPDSCGEICDQFKKTDDRIKVLHKSNGGLSDARNAGMSIATGEYLSFIDGDDYINEHFYEMLIRRFDTNDCDIVECYSVSFEEGSTPKAVFSEESITLTPYEWLTESGLGDFLSCVVWNKLYKKELFDNVLFPVGRKFEDEATTYKAIYKAKSIVRIKSALYYYRQRSGSITQSQTTLKELEEKFLSLDEKCRFFDAMNETTIRNFSCAKLAIFMASAYTSFRKQNGNAKDWYRRIRKLFFTIVTDRSVPVKYKVYLFAFLIAPRLVSN